MAKNYMAAVAKMLGMELGEEFIIENQDRKETVVISLDGFHVIQPNNVLGPDHSKLLSKVLQGLYEVKKKPWEPRAGEMFYFPDIFTHDPCLSEWEYSTKCLALKALGLVYRTPEEVRANFAEDYKKLTGRPLSSCQVDSK